MPNLKKADIVRRLGFPLELLEFRGQCYDLGPDLTKICALSQRPTRFCFTLKPLGGKGKVTIGPASFFLLKRHNPDLYIQLERGRLFLQIFTEAEARDLRQGSLQKRLGQTQKKFGALRMEARNRVYAWRAEHRRGELPRILANLKFLLARKQPEFTEHDSAMLWYEQSIVDLENELLAAPSAGPTPATTPVRIKEVKPRTFRPVPEIEF